MGRCYWARYLYGSIHSTCLYGNAFAPCGEAVESIGCAIYVQNLLRLHWDTTGVILGDCISWTRLLETGGNTHVKLFMNAAHRPATIVQIRSPSSADLYL